MNKMIRFAIPFHLSNYSELNGLNCKKLEDNGWEKNHIVSGENDLYDYITNLINGEKNSSIATSWTIRKQPYLKGNYETQLSEKIIKWRISDMGLLIFKTEVGILWYEIQADDIENINQLYDFVYSIKELSYSGKIITSRVRSIPVESENCKEVEIIKNNPKIKKTKFRSTKEGIILQVKEEIALYLDVIMPLISPLKIDSFFSNRVKKEQLCPDRAMAFLWFHEQKTLQDDVNCKNIAFHLGRNYKSSYEMSSKIKDEDFYIPFEDSIWYGSLEGCANYTCPLEEKQFYNDGYKGRLDTYYYLYLLCLGQYYSLLELAQEVSVLPISEQMYSSKNNILEDMLDKIHIFNLKNNYSQVGHLTQHNEFYEYLQKRLGINRMQEELEIELQALFEMIDRKKTIKQEKNRKVLTIIGGIFVVLQAFVNVAAMYSSVIEGDWGYFFFAMSGCLVLCVVGLILWLLDRIIKN